MSKTPLPSFLRPFPSSSQLAHLRVLGTGVAVVGSTVLAAKTYGLVGSEVTDAGVESSANSEANDDT